MAYIDTLVYFLYLLLSECKSHGVRKVGFPIVLPTPAVVSIIWYSFSK